MEKEMVDAEFTPLLRSFLEKLGYSHILSAGVQTSTSDIEGDGLKEIYWLAPLKPDDPRLQFEETEQTVQPIDDSEVFDMASGQDTFTFMIQIQSTVHTAFLNNL